MSRAGSAACYAAPHDGRRPGRGQEGAGCQRRFPVITARSMDCSSEPGVIAAGLPAASFARRGRGGADRSHRAVPSLRRQLRSLGRHALGSVLAGLAVLVIGAPEQANAQTPNTPATGAPTITGTAQVGVNLSASPGTIADADGLTTPNYSYQWILVDGADEADIPGRTTGTYNLTNAQVGKTIRVRASFTDDAGNAESRTSAPTATVEYRAPSTFSVTVGVGQAVLVWGPPVTGGLLFTHYEYRYSAGGMISPTAMWQQVQTGTGGPQAYYQVVKGLTSGTPHTFQVRTATDVIKGASATMTATPVSQPSCTIDELGDRRLLWQGQLTAGVLAVSNDGDIETGYGTGGTETGTLTPDAVTFRSTTYSVTTLTSDDHLNVLLRELDSTWYPGEEVVDALRWHVCNTPYDFSSAAVPGVFDEFAGYQWNVGFNWPAGIERTLRLSLPANNVATGEPAISGTAQAGQDLTADASLIMDTDGLTDVDFTYQWLRVDADGMSNPADITDATAATYTLTAADAGKKIKVQVSFTDELSGEEERTSAAYPSSGTVTTAASTTAPALLSVTVTSTPHKTTDTYGAREHIEFSMTFDASVTVTDAPTFAFDLGGPSTATWYAGSGTATLRFSHAVTGGSSGDRDTNGISWAENAIALNGGTIAGTDNAAAAVLTHVAQSNLAAHKVDGRTTAVTPATVTDVVVTSTPMLMASGSSTADTYGFGETIVITVTVSEAVEVEGDPEFEFSMNNPGGAANDVPATYDRTRSSPTTMAFAYTVQAGDMDSDGIWIGTHSRTFMLDVNDRIRTASQQIDIDRSHPEYGTHDGHKVDGSLGAPTVPPDPTAPTLVSATATTLTIEWTHPGDGGSPLTRNFIEYRVEGTTDWTNWYRGETPTQVTRTVITNLAAATAYDVRVHSTNAIGNSQWVQSATAFSTLVGGTAATGAPAITGTAAVGQVLAVDLTGIEDADGLTNVSYSYQWVRVDADGTSNPADIADATDATYTLVYADLGKTLKVRVTFDDDGGNTETLTSAATATVTPAAGTPGSPTIVSATVGVGQVVLVWTRPDSRAEWSHYEYRSSPGAMIAPDAMWQQVQSSPGFPNQAYFQVVKGLTNDTPNTLQVRAANAQGGSAPATVTATPISQPSCTIDELGDRRLLWQAQLTAGVRQIYTDGNLETGYGAGGPETGTLTPDAFTFRSTSYSLITWTSLDHLNVNLHDSDLNSWFPREEVVDALRWHVCNTPYDFSDATVADVFAEHGDYRWNVDSNWPAGIERTLRLSLPPNHPATGDPVISGTVQVGEELTALTDGIMDEDELDDVFTYQWVRVDADGTSNEEDITDATDATYTLTDDERGKKVKVAVRFVDILGGEETRTSAPTETVPGVTVSTPALTVPEEDTAGDSYTVVLNSQPTATVTVTVAGHAGTDVTPSPTTLTFTPTNWGTAQTVTVTAGDDADTANESVSLTHSAASTDSDYQGITIAGVAVTVTDNDDTNTAATGKPTITGTAQVGETLTAVTTGIMDVDGLTNPEYKYQWIRVNGPEADIADANSSTYTLGAADLGTTLKVRVTFRDDDKSNTETRTSAATETVVAVAMTTPGVTVSKTELTVTEEDPTGDSYTVVLNTQPTATVTVTVAGHAGTDVTPSPTSLTFTSTTWGTAQTVTVTAGNDANLVNETVSLTHSATNTDSDYQGITIAGVEVTVTDNDDTNTAPVFSSSNVSREIAENTAAGQNVGAAVTATDTDTDDTLGYTLGGPGAASFDFVESSGQIRTKTNVSYDFEAKSSYTVMVTASDGTGTAVATVTISVTDVAEPPDAPATPMVNAVSGSTTSLAVSWAAPANAGKPAIASYDVQYRVGSSGAWSDGPVDVTGTSTTIASLVASTDYEARVRATNAEGNSGWSDPPGSGRTNNATTRPPPPPPPVTGLAQVMGVGVAPGNAQLVVTWTAVSTATGYTVQWMSGGQGYTTGDRQAPVTSGSTARHTISSLINGTEYTVRVIATRTGVTDGPPSAEMTGTPFTTPGAPQHLSGVPGDEQVMLTWDAPSSDGGSAILRYEYAIDDSGTWIDAGLDLEETVPGLTNGQQYAFEVRAVNSAGPGAPARTAATPLGMPSVPESLTATGGDGEVVLEWTEPADDGGAPVTGYEYRLAAGTAVPGDTPWQSAGLDLEWTVTGLTNGQQYAFEVRARNRVGEGEARGALATPVARPGALASLTATAGDEEVALVWSAPADDGGSPVTGYGYRYAAGQAVPEDVTWRDAGTELTATVSGLENETRYTFEVRARNRVGPGETSGTTALPLRLRAELFSTAVLATEGEALVVGVRRSGRLAFPAHAYIGVTDSALPGVTATEEGRDDGLGRHRLEFATGAAEATVTVTVAFDGERRQDRVLTATLDSAELEVDGVRRPYELVTPTLVVPVTEGDAGLSVADARVQGKSSVLAFTVSLDRTRDVAVRVDYATEDGAARAGEDYTPVSGTLTIEAGGRERTVEVPVLPALHVTGERTLTLRLSNAVSAVIDDGVATGVIVRESELPKAWLARFGRTASDHAAQAIARRLEAGQRETQVTVAGRRVDGLSVDGLLLGVLPSGGWRPASAVEDMATRLAAPALAASRAPFGGVDADPGTPGLRAGTWGGAPGALDREPFADAEETLRRAVLPDFGFRLPGAEEALMGTSFYVERGAQQDEGGGTWAAWGDVAATRFEGDAGGLALDGDVVTGTAGLDRQWRAVLVGLALSRSSGEGGYGTGAGTIASTLTSVHPYVQVRLGERAQVWGAAGWGRGGLEITPESGAAREADLRNSMAAAGARAVLMGAGGLEIALRSDFLWTETASDGTAALAEAVGTASRGRLMLEGAGQIQGLGGVVRPKVEGGVRYDGGDAETGQGFEVGGGLDWARGSLTLQVNGRMLVAHADESYEEWGYSGSLVYEPGADGLGLQMRVGSSAGAAASGIRNLWALENASGLVRGGAVPFAQRFDAEVGYGIGRGTLWYPYFVADDSGQTRYGLKLSSGRTMGVGLEFGRRKSVDLGPEDAMLLRGELRF